MSTVNKRIFQPQAHTINAIGAGGLVTHRIEAGYDDINQNPVDGHQLAFADLLTEYVRGSFMSQDWVHIIELLTGTVGASVFYERKSGTAEALGYVKHTLNNPVVYKASLNLQHRKYASIDGSYECRAADDTKGILDMWEQADNHAAPTALEALRALEITACVHGAATIYHVTGLKLDIVMELLKASHDGDVGYTAVDALLGGLKVSGTLTFQDASIATGYNTAAKLATSARGNLVLTVKQAQGAADKTLTIAGVRFTSAGHDTNADSKEPDEFSLPFICTNSFGTVLTLAGTNKIITIT